MKKGLSVNGGCRIWSWVFFWLQSASVGECVWLKAVWNCDPPSEDFCIFLWEFQVWWRVATTPHTLANLLFGAELKCDHKIFLLTFASNPPTFNWHLDNFPSVQLQLHLNFWIEIRIKKKKKKSRPDGRLGGNSVISLMLRMWFLVASTVFAATKEAKEPHLESPGWIVWSCKFTNCVSVTLLRYASGLETQPQNFCTILERFCKLRRFHCQFILGFFKQVPREPFFLSTTRLF